MAEPAVQSCPLPYKGHIKGCDETPNDRIGVLADLCNPLGP